MALSPSTVPTDGDRVGWNRDVALEVAAWLRVMALRVNSNLEGLVPLTNGMRDEISERLWQPIFGRLAAINWLILRVDESWDRKTWLEAVQFVADIVREDHEHPESSGETGGDQCDRVS